MITAILGAIVVALLSTAFVVFVASLFLFPTILFTTLSACFMFFWLLAGSYVFAYLQEAGFAPSHEAIDDSVNTWTGGRFSWSAMGTSRDFCIKERPRAEPQDSAVSVGVEPLTIIEEVPEVDTEVANMYTKAPRKIHDSMDSQNTVIGPKGALTSHMKIPIPAIKIDSQSSDSVPSRNLASQMESPKEEKPSGSGKPITYVKLRKEHPDGLRVDRKGLFKVDDIASNSSLEDAKDRAKAIASRSGNTSFFNEPISPKTIPKHFSIGSDTSTRAVGIDEEILDAITTIEISP
jgi:hypothetical protein